MKRYLQPALLTLAVCLAGCASSPRLSDPQRLALYVDHAGAPVSSMPLRGQLHGWTALGDEAVVLWTRPREAWLVDLVGRCQDLGYATAIAVNSNFSRLQAHSDSITPLGSMVSEVGRMPCRIRQIRPLDTATLKQAEDGLRQATLQGPGR